MDIFVGNLPYDMEESAIEEAFSAYGQISNVKLLKDYDSGRSRGIAFVTMEDQQEAEAAIEGMDGVELGGRPLRVNEARERSSRPPRQGGGGGGRGGDFRRGGGGGGGYRGGNGGGGGGFRGGRGGDRDRGNRW